MKVAVANHDLLAFEPAIWFDHGKGKRSKSDSNQSDKDKFVKFDVPVNRDDDDDENTTKWSIRVFESGDAEDYCQWRSSFDELAEAKG